MLSDLNTLRMSTVVWEHLQSKLSNGDGLSCAHAKLWQETASGASWLVTTLFPLQSPKIQVTRDNDERCLVLLNVVN